MNFKLHRFLVLILTSIMLILPAYADDYHYFWDKEFWQDKNEATPLDRKFYDESLIFKFCNKSRNPVTIAIGYWKSCCNKGDFFITEGWWNVEPEQCKIPFNSGKLVRTNFYLYIQVYGKSITDDSYHTEDGYTGGTKGCVEPKAFVLLTQESMLGRACKGGEKEVPFLDIKDANKYNEYIFAYK